MKENSEQLKAKMLSLLREFAVYAHKDKLVKDGDYTYDPNTDTQPLSIEFDESTLLSYDGMKVTKSGGTYWLKFKAIGHLEAELLSAELPCTFTVLLINDKFRDVMYIDQDLDLNKKLYQALFEDFDQDIDTDKLTSLVANLEKLLLMKTIKFSSN
jgi:hypothetical protein